MHIVLANRVSLFHHFGHVLTMLAGAVSRQFPALPVARITSRLASALHVNSQVVIFILFQLHFLGHLYPTQHSHHGDLIFLDIYFDSLFSCWPSSTSLTIVTACHAPSHLVPIIIIISITITCWELSIFSLFHPTWVNSHASTSTSKSPSFSSSLFHHSTCPALDPHQSDSSHVHVHTTDRHRGNMQPKHANAGHRHHHRHRSRSSPPATSDSPEL